MNYFKLGLCSVTFRKKTAEQIVDIAKKADVSYIEWGGDVHVRSLEDAKKVKALCDKAGIKISSYGRYINSAEYSEENWNLISQYALETKAYLSENITVNTANVHIEREINNLKAKVMDIMTIEQQRIKDLTEARANAIKEIKEYEKSLKASMFEEEIYSLVVERIGNSKNIINSLESIESINKLVRDTIQAVEDAKK